MNFVSLRIDLVDNAQLVIYSLFYSFARSIVEILLHDVPMNNNDDRIFVSLRI